MRRTGTRFVRIDDYNRMIWRAAHWPRIKEQTPQFTWLLELLWHRLPAASDPLQMLKALLKAEGVNCGLWRVLHEQGTRWMRLFMPYYTLGARGSGRAALDLLRLISLLGRPQLPPMWMLQAVLNERGNPNAPKERYAAGWSQPDRQPLLWRLMHWHHSLAQVGDDATLERLQQLMPVILHWADGHRELIASPWLQKVGAKRFMQRIVQWDRELDVSVGEQSDWASRYVFDQVGGAPWYVVELTSQLQVLREGRVMRHCADVYMQQCSEGSYLMLSIRDSQTDRRVATVGYTLDEQTGEPAFDQIAGFANTKVAPKLRELALQCEASMRQQWHQQRIDALVRQVSKEQGDEPDPDYRPQSYFAAQTGHEPTPHTG